MDFLELAKRRFSCRQYDSKPVEQEKIDLVLEAGRVAPSAKNIQPCHFVVVRDTLNEFAGVYHREWLRSAPAAIVVCGDHDQSWKKGNGKDHCDIDIAIATDHMTLMATSLGLATCWICNFDAGKCSRFLKLPGNMEPIVILPLGYPQDSKDPERHEKERKPIEKIISRETYSPE